MFRKIFSHLWIVIIVSFIVYCIAAAIAEYGIIDVAKAFMVIGVSCIIVSSFMMWLLSFYDENDIETSGYQPKGGTIDEHEHHNTRTQQEDI